MNCQNTDIKTSASHPLRIDEVNIPRCRGRIGMTFCPGKKQLNAVSGIWDRDLETDLRAIRTWGASILITLMEEKEFSEFKVPDLPKYAKGMSFEWIHLPIQDVSVHSAGIEDQWRAIVKVLKRRLLMGDSVVFHCKGGLGRTGSIAGNILGALLGKKAIPENWIHEVELSNVIEEVSHDLFKGYEEDEAWWNRYPGY